MVECSNTKTILAISVLQKCEFLQEHISYGINFTIRRIGNLKKIMYLLRKRIRTFNKYCHLLRIHIALQNYYSKKMVKSTVETAIIKNKSTDVFFNSRLSRHITGFLFNIKSYKPKK